MLTSGNGDAEAPPTTADAEVCRHRSAIECGPTVACHAVATQAAELGFPASRTGADFDGGKKAYLEVCGPRRVADVLLTSGKGAAEALRDDAEAVVCKRRSAFVGRRKARGARAGGPGPPRAPGGGRAAVQAADGGASGGAGAGGARGGACGGAGGDRAMLARRVRAALRADAASSFWQVAGASLLRALDEARSTLDHVTGGVEWLEEGIAEGRMSD